MTATISPPAGATHLARRGVRDRLDDYCNALRYYLSLPSDTFDRVVLVDNSNSDVSELLEIAESHAGDKRVSVLSFEGNDHPPEWGKAYGEFRLINHALEQATELSSDNGVFWKVTGRLRCTNLVALARSRPRSCTLYADLRRFRDKWFDLRTWAADRTTYSSFFASRIEAMREDLLPNVAPERYLFDEYVSRRGEYPELCPRFKIEPVWEGFGGQFNLDLTAPRFRRKAAVRRATRRLTPWLWI